MKKRVKIYALILLALCLAVPSVNAVHDVTIGGSGTIYLNLGATDDLEVQFSTADGYIFSIRSLTTGSYNSNTKILTLDKYQTYCYGEYTLYRVPPFPENYVGQGAIRISYSYVEPTPEPTPIQTPYISATLYNTGANNLYYDYNVICMPAEGYLFAPLSFYSYGSRIPQCDLTSAETSIQVRVWAGEDIPMYSCALSGSGGAPNFQYIQTVLSAPVYAVDTVINATTVKDNLQDVSNPVNPSPNNPIKSGYFQPIGKNAIVNSPFGNLVSNGGVMFSLPHMDDPSQLRENLLNGTQNLTAPLYDAVDSVTGAVLFVPSVISGALSSVVSPLLETVDILKSVFDSLFEVINNCMNFFYYLLPTVYLLIPDAVWWCINAVLCYFIFKWILIFVFGNDVINAYFEKGGKE